MDITEMSMADFDLFWPTFREVVKAQQTYAIEPEITYEEAHKLWCETPEKTYVAKDGEDVLGSYYIKANAKGPGNHVANCGYMVTEAARGQGVARALCEHSQDVAKTLGFTAMQFNAVVATNKAAVHLWQDMGFEIIGRLPGGFRHPVDGKVDCLIMFKDLEG